MSVEETMEIITKQWCNLTDLMKLLHCGRNKALDIKKQIKNKLKPRMLKPTRFGKIPSLYYIFANVNANIADIAQFLSQKSKIRNILTLCDNGCIFIDKRVDPLFIPTDCCMCRKMQ